MTDKNATTQPRTVWFMVCDISNPAPGAEPHAVLRADINNRDEHGHIISTVESLHWIKAEAHAVAEQRNREVEGLAAS